MSDADTGPEVTELLADLTQSLRELQTEMEPERRLPTPRQLSQFTSEVAIPGLILILQTNIKALQLLQRTIRLAEGREPRSSGSAVPEMRERAEELSRATLAQLDDTLSDIQSAVEGRPEDDETRQLLSEARRLRDEIRDELESGDAGAQPSDAAGSERDGAKQDGVTREEDMVDIDVEAELRSLKGNLEDDEPDSPGEGPTDGDRGGEEAASDDDADGDDSSGGEGADDGTHPDDATGPDHE